MESYMATSEFAAGDAKEGLGSFHRGDSVKLLF